MPKPPSPERCRCGWFKILSNHLSRLHVFVAVTLQAPQYLRTLLGMSCPGHYSGPSRAVV